MREVGWASKRYTELFNADGNLVADDGIVGAFNDIIISGLEPQVVQGYCAESFRFLAWLTALQRPVQEVTDLQIAGYIRNCLGRGKSVPGRVRLALVWLQRLIDCPLGAGKEDLVMMVRSLSSGTQSEKTPVAARMIPVEIVRLLERGCFNATTDLLRVFCGLGCLLAFGIKRWSDAQRVQSLDLAVDSLVVQSWKSKKKKSSIPWGALRSGFEQCDWPTGFLDALKMFDFPGEDFLICAPRTDLFGFTRTPARWGDAERGIHAALIDVGVPVDEAITYTLHSFKHLLVTAGRQLQVPEPAIDVMAGWSV